MGRKRILPYFIDIMILITIIVFLSVMIKGDHSIVFEIFTIIYTMIGMYSLRTYDTEKCRSWNSLFISIIVAFAFSTVLSIFTAYIIGDFIIARKYIFYFAILGISAETFLHRAYPFLLTSYSKEKVKNVILYGISNSNTHNKVVESLKNNGRMYGLAYKGIIDFQDDKWYLLNGGPRTEISEIKRWLKEKMKERELILLKCGDEESLSRIEKEVDFPIVSDEFMYELIEKKLLLDPLSYVEIHEASFPRWYDNVKLILDEIVGFVGTVLSFPFILVFALIIFIEDFNDSPIYTQTRLGKDGKPYKLYKIRSMKSGAEKSTGAVWSNGKEDPRILKTGKFMRKFRIDELPQFWNILKGDMSFIGPRPERPEIVEKLKKELPFYALRLKIKPGITGWAQINHHYDESIEDVKEKLRYDLYYIKNRSLALDLNIFLLTVETVIFGRGAK